MQLMKLKLGVQKELMRNSFYLQRKQVKMVMLDQFTFNSGYKLYQSTGTLRMAP